MKTRIYAAPAVEGVTLVNCEHIECHVGLSINVEYRADQLVIRLVFTSDGLSRVDNDGHGVNDGYLLSGYLFPLRLNPCPAMPGYIRD